MTFTIKNPDYPKIYLWFTSFSKGEHCNSISLTASAIAEEMVEMEENLGRVQLGDKAINDTNAQTKFKIFERINQLEPGMNDYFEFADSSWSTITLLDVTSLSNVQKLLNNEKPILISFNINGTRKKQVKKIIRKHKK